MADFGEPIPGAVPPEVIKQTNQIKLVNSATNISTKEEGASKASDRSKNRPQLSSIQETPEGFMVTTPAGYTDIGAIGSYSRAVGSQEEAERIIQDTRRNFNPRVELASLNKSFSSFHSIQIEDGDKYSVTFPALRSVSNPNLLAGTNQKTFDTWEEAKNFYLETRNNNEYLEEAVFQLKIDGIDYRFSHLNKFGQRPRLSDHPSEFSESTKVVLDFDSRNNPNPDSAYTYYKTLGIPGWQSQAFRFVEGFTKTAEGQRMIGQLGISDLRLLTPQQAARLTLEVVTRLKKYNLEEMGMAHGETESDQNSALFLLQRGLRNRDNADFKGNGVCRNFASAVKVIFEGLKTNQTKFNYLQDTHVFYESGPRADFDPTYEAQSLGVSVSLKQDKNPGHAWNSFVTVDEGGVSQAIVDATWSDFDYDTQESVKLDYTLQRMEKDVYRNLKRKDAKVDAGEAVQFYVFLLDSLPQQEGLVLDPETVTRARASDLYNSVETYVKSKYSGLTSERYDDFTLKVYKQLVDEQSLKTKTQFYLSRAMEVVRGREQALPNTTATELTRLVAEVKQDVGYFDVVTVYNLPTERVEDRLTTVRKYVKAWETANVRGYVPIRDLTFGNKEAQEAVLQSCLPQTREMILKELSKSKLDKDK
jgi:hypothetical protein